MYIDLRPCEKGEEPGVSKSISKGGKCVDLKSPGWTMRKAFSDLLLVLLQLQRCLPLRPHQRPEEALSGGLSRQLCQPHSNSALPRGFCSCHCLLNDRRAWPRQPCLRVHSRGRSAKQPPGLWPEQPNKGWVKGGGCPGMGSLALGLPSLESYRNVFSREKRSGSFGQQPNIQFSRVKWNCEDLRSLDMCVIWPGERGWS